MDGGGGAGGEESEESIAEGETVACWTDSGIGGICGTGGISITGDTVSTSDIGIFVVVDAIKIKRSAINLNEQNVLSILRPSSQESSLSRSTIFLKLPGFQPTGYINHDDQESFPSKFPSFGLITTRGHFLIFSILF